MLFFVTKQFDKAEPYFRDYLSYVLKHDPNREDRFVAKSRLGACFIEQKKFAQAEPLLLSAYDEMKARAGNVPSSKQLELRNALERIARLYREWGKKDKADLWKNRFDDLVFPADSFVRP
jgi:non-specific serine/threonine protein kinase/serine/threonine-protein kinase